MKKEEFKKLIEERLPITLELCQEEFQELDAKKYDYWVEFLDKLIEELNGDNKKDLEPEDIKNYFYENPAGTLSNSLER